MKFIGHGRKINEGKKENKRKGDRETHIKFRARVQLFDVIRWSA